MGAGVVVRINGRVLYRPGDSALRPESDAILGRIAGLVQGTRHRVMVEGHTDDLPISTARYPSNWELSTARAISGMRYLVDNGVEAGRVGVAGYADQRPLEPNDNVENRALNRRVEFVFIRETSDDDEQVEQAADADASAPPTPADLDGEDPPAAAGL